MKKYIWLMAVLVLLCTWCSAETDINKLDINSRSVYMVNLNNDRVMLSHNADKKMEPASLTKIMTALVVLENCEDIENEKIYIADDSIFHYIKREGGSNIALKAGETLTVKDLLYATMLPSACDAAELLAYHFGNGNTENFIDMMNARAQEIGAKDTVFKNAHGLNADGHITTAYDMYLITREALKNERFSEIISASTYSVPATAKTAQRDIKYTVELTNRNSSNYYRYASGIKTGFTDQAGRCLITMATKDEASYLLVLMGANLDGAPSPIKTFPDAKNLFEYVFNSYKLVKIADKNTTLAQTEVYFSQDNTKQIEIIAASDIDVLLPNDVTPDMLQREYNYLYDLSLPILKGDVIGTVTVMHEGEKLAVFDIASGTDIYDALSDGGFTFYPAKEINKLTIVKFFLICGTIVCLFGIVIIFNGKNKKRTARRSSAAAQKRKINK